MIDSKRDSRLSGRRYLVALLIALASAAALLGFAVEQPLITFSSAFFAVALVALWVGSGFEIGDVFRPYYCVIALLFLYSVATPLLVATTGAAYFGEVVDPADLTTYYAACLSAAAGLSVGTLFGAAGSTPRVSGETARSHHAEHRALLISTFLICLATARSFLPSFDIAAAKSYGDEALAMRVGWMADPSAGLTETMFKTIPTMLVLFVSTVAVFRSRRLPIRIVGAAALFGYLGTNVLSGMRGGLMIGLLVMGVYVHYKVRPFRWREVMIGGLAVYVLVNGLAIARVSADPREMLHAVRDELGNRGLGFLALERSGELGTSSNLLRLISGIRAGESDFGWGSIALGQFAAFVPRSLLPGRPDMASEHFVKVFYPGVFESGGGYGFFMVQDGYWDFGLFGAFLYCALYAFALERLYRALRPRFGSDLFVLLYALLYTQLALSVARSGLVASIKAALIAALPALIPMALSRVRIRAQSADIRGLEAAT